MSRKIVLMFSSAPYILAFSYKESRNRVPFSLALHGREQVWSHPWRALLTVVINSCHGREQLTISASYSYFPYRKKQRCKRLKRTLVLSYGWLHYRQQTNHPFGERWKPSFLLWRRKEKVQKSIIPKPGLTKKSILSRISSFGKEEWSKTEVVGEIMFVPISL